MNKKTIPGRYWVGANDREQEEKFVNPDGSNVTYNEWMPGRPNKDGDCVAVGTWIYGEYWEDFNCNEKSNVICEAKNSECEYSLIPGSVVLNNLPTGDKCSRFGNKGYLFSSKMHLNFDAATKYCAGMGMRLTKVHSSEHNKWLTDHILYRVQNRWWWIGASDKGHEGKWTYTDGTPVEFTNWNRGTVEHCAGVSWGSTREHWNDFSCSIAAPFICESDHPECEYSLQSAAPLTHEIATGDQCSRYGSKSYLFHNKVLRTFDEASEYCSDLGMQLAKINTDAHNTWLADVAYKIQTNWWYFGANDKAEEGKWIYEDGSPVNYTNWFVNQPDNTNLNEHCATLNWSIRTQWNDYPCTAKGKFICEANNDKCSFKIKDNSTITKKVKTGDQCGRYNNRGYLFRYEDTNFYDASMYCCSLGMRLTKVRDAAHSAWLGKISSEIKWARWWIGATDAAKEANWIYQDSTKVGFTKWNTNQPDNAGKKEHCACIGYGSIENWNDFPCTYKLPYICESDNVNCF